MSHSSSGHAYEADQPKTGEHTPVILHNRFRLEDFVERDDHVERWRAYDQVLNRVVGIQIVSRQHPNFEAIHRAAHRAGAVVDRRIVRVIDVVPGTTDSCPDLCIISEWVEGLPLDEFIHSPLNPQHSVAVTQSIVEAVIALSRTDLDPLGSSKQLGEQWGHGRITPHSVIVNPNGEIRLRGHLIQAAMYGTVHGGSIPEEDIDSIGAVLEACLTARWPGPVNSHLEQAPNNGEDFALPGQLRAWLPSSIDQFVTQTRLGQNQHKNLEEVRLGLLSIKQELPADGDGMLPLTDDSSPSYTKWLRLGMGIAASVIAVGLVGMGAVAVFQSPDSDQIVSAQENSADSGAFVSGAARQAADTVTEDGSLANRERELPIVAAWGFQEDHKRLASTATGALVHDKDIATGWKTKSYPRANLSDSDVEGLLIDLGSTQSISAFNLDLVGADSDFIITTGPKGKLLQGKGAKFAAVEQAPSNFVVRKARPAQARFVAITFTKVPLGTDGYQGGILSIEVLGQ